MGPLWRRTPVSRAFLYISFRVLSKEALLPGWPRIAPVETDPVFPEPPVICLSDRGKRAPVQVPRRGLYEERRPSLKPSFSHLSEPQKKSLLIKQNLTFLSKSPVRETPLFMFPQRCPYEERCSVSRANGVFVHSHLSESPVTVLSREL